MNEPKVEMRTRPWISGCTTSKGVEGVVSELIEHFANEGGRKKLASRQMQPVGEKM